MTTDPTAAALAVVRALGADTTGTSTSPGASASSDAPAPVGVFAPVGDPVSCETPAGGTYNTVVRMAFGDGRDWVVKIPPAHSSGLRYEHALLTGEVTFYEAAAGLGGVVPRVVRAGLGGVVPRAGLGPGPATGPYVVMTACPGRPWSELADELTDVETRRLRAELGALVGRLHRVTGPAGFGYPGEPFGPLAPTWRAAFTAMAAAVLDDAEEYGVRPPRPVGEIRTLLGTASYVLDEVVRPALVHFDLWQGNVLVAGGPGARSIGGIIDGERMFWGDPAADLVSLALLGDIEEDEDFLTGYASSAGAPLVFTPSLRLRLALYRSYLYLIMLVETVPRQASAEDRAWVWTHVAPELDAALDSVARATG
ncbi:phosphotransferase family protein [Streptomyces nitrosporeus]|uniref:phosphotransferase family protein n=1 Tax=Streptomyces nitrosporeus TaxID=28894 RepID=UPI00333386EA